MKNLVIMGTGNSRFLKSVADFKERYPDYDSFVAALVAGTLPVDFNGLNPDGITQMGTPYAMSAVLTDETAALFGLDNTAEPNDVFRWLGEWGRSSWKLLAEYNAAGAHTFIVPDDVDELGVFVLGGGSGGEVFAGAASDNYLTPAIGGSSGGLTQRVLSKKKGNFVAGSTISVIVGEGGPGGTISIANGGKSGSAGGMSSFGEISSGSGWQFSDTSLEEDSVAPYGLEAYRVNSFFRPLRGQSYVFGYNGRNIFDANDLHVYCGAGGGAYCTTSRSVAQSVVSRIRGRAGAGRYVSLSNEYGNDATAPGDGGGALWVNTSSRVTATAGSGADGLVLVYGRKVVPTDAV